MKKLLLLILISNLDNLTISHSRPSYIYAYQSYNDKRPLSLFTSGAARRVACRLAAVMFQDICIEEMLYCSHY